MSKIEIANYIIKNEKIPKEFNDYRIVQISDLHNKSFGKNNHKLLKQVDKVKPDIIFITGDLIDGESKNFNNSLELVKNLTGKYKVYYITGNHEQKSLVKRYKDLYVKYFEELSTLEATHLDNDFIKITKGNNHINLYGLTIPFGYYKYLFDNDKNTDIEDGFLNKKLGTLNRDEYNILLVHTPFYFDEYEKWGADLILAGHVHGGIIRLPFVGGLLSPNRTFFPKYDLGLYEKNNSTMIVSKGLGGSKALVRINCKPEIVCIELKNK